jgi:hypothetical protein
MQMAVARSSPLAQADNASWPNRMGPVRQSELVGRQRLFTSGRPVFVDQPAEHVVAGDPIRTTWSRPRKALVRLRQARLRAEPRGWRSVSRQVV